MEADHGVHELGMILARHFANDVLLETGQGAERVDYAIVQIELSRRDG